MTNTSLTLNEINELKETALKMRKTAIKMATKAGEAHLGPALDLTEIIVTLYSKIMNYRASDPKWPKRDRLILSKGHGCLALYTILAEKGFYEKELLDTFCTQLDTLFGGHPEVKVPGIEANTGSLGHGFNIGIGMAKAAQIDNFDYKVYTILGDGENQEGSIWEGAMAAPNLNIDNLIAIVDRNHLQVSGRTEKIMNIDPLKNKWESFGWAVQEIDGHDFSQIYNALNSAPFKPGKPSLIIANTIKAKGLSFAENKVEWHHKVPNEEEYRIADKELGLGGLNDD